MKYKDKQYAEQERTRKDLQNLLQQYHKGVMIRPTGFGKTTIMTDLIHSYKKVLYLYPAAVIRDSVVERYYDVYKDDVTQDYIDEDNNVIDPETIDTFIELKQIDKCDLMTYSKLIRLSKAEMEDMRYDLIIMDELHRIGAPCTRQAVTQLFETNASHGTHFCGATATPCRMDDVDVVAEFFGNHMCYTFTMKDAIDMGIIQKPIYKYMTYDHKKNLEASFRDLGEDIKSPEVSEIIDARAAELAEIYNMPTIVKDVCDANVKDTSYMKFIIFFRNILHMDKKMPEVQKWFETAYPTHKVETLNISSKNKEESKNTDKLGNLTYKKNTIQLIGCVDMLNLGYHVDITGIFMYRGTSSNIIFVQQFGRALSAGSKTQAVVFDLVDNIHRPAIFELKAKNEIKHTKKKSKTTQQYIARTDLIVSPEDNKTILKCNHTTGQTYDSGMYINTDNLIVYKSNQELAPFEYNPEDNMIYNNNPVEGKQGVNNIDEECLVATANDASYRDMIRKITAEPMVQRCKSAFEIHFRTWCYNNHIKYPISDKELEEIYHKSPDEFMQIFANSIRKNKIAYPLQDAKKLIAIGSHDNDVNVPLAICAKARNVSVEMVLDLLFSPEWRKSLNADTQRPAV